jgi:hypothetical protein
MLNPESTQRWAQMRPHWDEADRFDWLYSAWLISMAILTEAVQSRPDVAIVPLASSSAMSR